MNHEIAITQAVVDRINAAALGVSAARGYAFEKDVLLLATSPACAVMHLGLNSQPDTRGAVVEVHKIGIAVYQRVTGLDNATIDPLVELTQQVRDLFRNSEVAGAGVQVARSEPLYDPEWLLQHSIYLGFAELECRGVVQIGGA